MPDPKTPSARERLDHHGSRALSDAELLTVLLGPTSGANSTAKAAAALLEAAPITELAWATPDELTSVPGIGPTRAAALAAAFELGRRAGWTPPQRGERVLSPERVRELLRHVAHADQEQFWIVLLDVRGRLIKPVQIAVGSLTQCPVNPREVFLAAVRANAHSVIFVHNHPSTDASPSADDVQLTERLRAASELLGVASRDHVILSASGYYSFVEAGRWRR